MARVEFPRSLLAYTQGQELVEVPARDVRELISRLEERFPELGERLRKGMAVAIDGEIHNDPWLELLEEDSEVCFLPSISGG